MSYTELKIMKSNAGYYVGRGYMEGIIEVPGSRESGYYATKEEAEKAFDFNTFDRDCSENRFMYETHPDLK